MYNHLYIIRGIPGSGKSTFARKLIARGMADVYYEADMFFEKNGRYQYDATKIGQAHAWCQNQVMRALHQGKNVVVSNTFTTISEILPYTRFCRQNHIPFQVVRLTTNFGSIHGVPADIIDRMKAQFQDWRGEMKIPQVKSESIIINKIKEMKKLNENTKVTLTIRQLRNLVKEAKYSTLMETRGRFHSNTVQTTDSVRARKIIQTAIDLGCIVKIKTGQHGYGQIVVQNRKHDASLSDLIWDICRRAGIEGSDFYKVICKKSNPNNFTIVVDNEILDWLRDLGI